MEDGPVRSGREFVEERVRRRDPFRVTKLIRLRIDEDPEVRAGSEIRGDRRRRSLVIVARKEDAPSADPPDEEESSGEEQGGEAGDSEDDLLDHAAPLSRVIVRSGRIPGSVGGVRSRPRRGRLPFRHRDGGWIWASGRRNGGSGDSACSG